MSREEWAGDVVNALATLDEHERNFLRLSYFDGVSQLGIAERTGLPLSGVARTIAHAMKHLANALEAGADRTAAA